MAEIRVLSREISELIAAGEVIDRPSAVIKELLENSIDSGADVVTVEIKNGGKTYIRITDNGCGMSKKDVSTAFLRHATSKISTKDDLDRILTLGFRGEALASVAAVAKVEVLTKMISEQFGCHYVIEGSVEKCLEDSGCQDGTTIIVRDLFYNVPARLKFLKKDVTEGNAIAAIVDKIAVSHPEISFKFIRDNKTDLLTAGDGKLYSAIYSVFGRDFAKTLIPVDYSCNGIEVTGYISRPLQSRPKRSFQNFYINNRYIKSITCMVALEEAYKNCIITGKFPACVLCLKIPPQLIDVNVHPTKTEVRFSDEKLIYNSVYFAVKNSLLKNDQTTELDMDKTKHFRPDELFAVPKEEPGVQLKMELSPQTAEPAPRQPDKPYSTVPQKTAVSRAERAERAKEFSSYYSSIPPAEEPFQPTERTEQSRQAAIPAKETEPPEETLFDRKAAEAAEEPGGYKYISSNSFVRTEVEKQQSEQKQQSVPRLVGEVFKTYIIAEMDGEMYLVDKHAAHERYIFEKIKRRETELSVQMLIEPVIVMLSFEEYDALMADLETVAKLGFAIEDDVAPGVSVRGIPSIIEGTNPNDIVPELADNFLKCKNDPQLDMVDELYHSIACKSAIKANDENRPPELEKLLDMIFREEDIRYCPHGRPVMVKLTKRDIEKQFRRVL